MKIWKEISWVWNAIPRTPQKPGVLMRLYYFWDEVLSPSGHALAAFILFTSFFLFIPGFSFAGRACLTLFIPLAFFVIVRFKPKCRIESVSVPMVSEGDSAPITVKVSGEGLKFCSVESFRMDTSIERLDDGVLRPSRRGVFPLRRIALVKLQFLGLSQRATVYAETVELLVAPRVVKISSIPFLVRGYCGGRFERLLRPQAARGFEFVGVREYRDGDSLRDLHQKAFARYGRPFTKEFAEESGSGIVVLLDVSARKWREKMCVESAIRLCGGVALWLLDRNLLGRFFIGDEEVFFEKAKSARSRILEALARVPRASLRESYELGNWNIPADTGSPVLSIGVQDTDRKNVDKRIVVSDYGPFGANPDASALRVSAAALSVRDGMPDTEVSL